MTDSDESSAKRFTETLDYIVSTEISGSADEVLHQQVLASAVQQAVEEEDLADLIGFAFSLGVLRGAVESKATRRKQREGGSANSKSRQVVPLLARKYGIKVSRTVVCEYAARLWEADLDRVIRVGDMTDRVMDNLDQLIHQANTLVKSAMPRVDYVFNDAIDTRRLPSKKTIRTWITEIAPPHARVRGRPKKK